MFIVSIFGGLGSQMDQYSFYLSLKRHYPNVNIKLSLCNIRKPDHNGYELGRVFGISAPEASIDEILALSDIYPYGGKYYWLMSKLNNIRRVLVGPKRSWLTPDDPSAFYKEVFELNPLKSYLFFGNWSNEEYRVDINKEISDSFKFPEITDEKNKQVEQAILETESVGIHVRRGDYIQYGFPMLSQNYYKEATAIIKSRIKDPTFFIFSNDIDYVKEHFRFLPQSHVISWNTGAHSFRDMQLMSLCKHQIIANSSFSYWSARLNRNNDAIVVCPKYHVDICKQTACMPPWIVLDNHQY